MRENYRVSRKSFRGNKGSVEKIIVSQQPKHALKSDITQGAEPGQFRTFILHLIRFMLFHVLFNIASIISGVWTFVTEVYSFRVRCFCMRTDVFKCFESQCFAQHTFPFFLDVRFGA